MPDGGSVGGKLGLIGELQIRGADFRFTGSCIRPQSRTCLPNHQLSMAHIVLPAAARALDGSSPHQNLAARSVDCHRSFGHLEGPS